MQFVATAPRIPTILGSMDKGQAIKNTNDVVFLHVAASG